MIIAFAFPDVVKRLKVVGFNLAALILEAAWGAIAAIGLVLAIRVGLRKSPL